MKNTIKQLKRGSEDWKQYMDLQDKVWKATNEVDKLRRAIKDMGLEHDIYGKPKNFEFVDNG